MRLQSSDNNWICRGCRNITTITNNQVKRRFPHLHIVSLSCRGVKGRGGETKRHHIAEDMPRYQVDVLALQETHLGGDGQEEIETLDCKSRYMIYHSTTVTNQTRAGTAIVVKKGINVTFKSISDRVCRMKIKVNNNYTLTIINAYTPTLPVSEKDPAKRHDFYNELETLVRTISKRDTLVITGYFNAKTGNACWREYPNNIGKYGKGKVNCNGKELLEFCNRQHLILANTLFRQKMAPGQPGKVQQTTLTQVEEETHV